MDDDEGMSSEEILAAFRAKKEGKRPVGDLDTGHSKAASVKDLFGPPKKRQDRSDEPAEAVEEPDGAREPEPPGARKAAPDAVPHEPSAPSDAPDDSSATDGRSGPADDAPPAEPPAAPPAPQVHETSPEDLLPAPRRFQPSHATAPPDAAPTQPSAPPSDAQRASPPQPEPSSAQPQQGEPHDDPPADAPSAVAALKQMPAGQPLTAMQPVMGLADRLLADTTVTVRGHPLARRIGLGVAVVGLLMLVLVARAAWVTGDRYVLAGTGLPVAALAWLFILLGAGTFVGFWYYPPARTLDVDLAPSQAREWERVQEEARLWMLLQWVGLGMLGGGLLLAALVYGVFPDAQVVAFSGLLVGVGVAGGALLFAAWTRRQTLHRLYIQTLVLSRLEATGLGPGTAPQKVVEKKDDRVAPVLKALDELLGQLPDSAVQDFLTTQQAEVYLQLIDEVNEDRDG